MQLHNSTRNVMDFHAYHCICHPGICAYHMHQVGGREEIYIIHVVPCRGKRVRFWFDSLQNRFASSPDQTFKNTFISSSSNTAVFQGG